MSSFIDRDRIYSSFADDLYASAGLTAYQRMDADRHWAPDVFLGMVTGLEVGRALGESHDDAAAGAATPSRRARRTSRRARAT